MEQVVKCVDARGHRCYDNGTTQRARFVKEAHMLIVEVVSSASDRIAFRSFVVLASCDSKVVCSMK